MIVRVVLSVNKADGRASDIEGEECGDHTVSVNALLFVVLLT